MRRSRLLSIPAALSAPLLALAVAGPLSAQAGTGHPGLDALVRPDLVRQQLAVERYTLQPLAIPAEAGSGFQVDVALDGELVRLTLVPHSVRAPGFKLLVQGADGSLHEELPAPPATYRGSVEGRPGSLVAGSIIDGELEAFVSLSPDRPVFGIQPAREADPEAPKGLHVVYDGADTDLQGFHCGNVDEALRPEPPPAPKAGDAAGDVVCDIACAADAEFYAKNQSSVTKTQTDIENVINAVEAIYQSTNGILYSITTTIVYTTEPDPFTATDPNTLLNQFKSNWNTNQGSVVRDIAHLFTGKNIDGSVIGIASLSVICSKSNGYGLVQSKYTSNFTSRTALSAHELGHNWSAQHCDGQGDCKIMCSALGACGSVTTFGASAKASIANKKNASNCLDDAVPPAPPVLASLAPSSAQVFQSDFVSINGSGLAKAKTIEVAGQVVNETGFTIVDDTRIDFVPPAPAALGPVELTVSNAGGTSNGVLLTYVETDPPKISAPTVGLTGNTHAWTYAGAAGGTGYLLVGFSNTSYQYQGVTLLATNLILNAAPLDAAGLGNFSLVLPSSAAGLTFWSQLAVIDGPELKSSPIVSTWIII